MEKILLALLVAAWSTSLVFIIIFGSGATSFATAEKIAKAMNLEKDRELAANYSNKFFYPLVSFSIAFVALSIIIALIF